MVYHLAGIDYVIELKWIDYNGANDSNRLKRTVKNTNRQKKIDVKEQAEIYGKVWLELRGRPAPDENNSPPTNSIQFRLYNPFDVTEIVVPNRYWSSACLGMVSCSN